MKHNKLIRVADIMVTDFDMVESFATIADALRQSQFLNNECMIVNRRHDNDEFGILLLADIAKDVLSVDKSPERINVYEIMSKPVIYVSPNMDIRYVARLFKKFGLTRAPVIKSGKILGLVGYREIILKGLLNSLDQSPDPDQDESPA